MSPSRIRLAALPTPLVRAPRLERALASGPVYLKRDDLTGFAVAGNKTRALEFLLGAAVAEAADVLVAAGSPTSNFCAAAAVAARVANLDCDVLFPGPQPSAAPTNVALAQAAGARLCFSAAASRTELDRAALIHADALRAAGRRPYPMPRGGATPVGALGYAAAARELAEQCKAAGIVARTIVVATGSGATQAGLIAGQVGFRLPGQVIGASVSRPGHEVAEQILALSQDCSALLGLTPPDASDVDVRDLRGAGFGIASEADRLSAQLALTHEGVLIDDYYGAKAMTLLRTLLSDGAPTPVIFWHTGGLVAALKAVTDGARV